MSRINLKKKIKFIIDEKIRFSIKTKITLSYSIMFIIMSVLSTFGIIYLFNKIIRNLDFNVYLTLITILIVFNVLEF